MTERRDTVNSEIGISARTESALLGRVTNALLGGICFLNTGSAISLIQSEFSKGFPDVLSAVLREPDKAGLLVLGAVTSALYLRVVMHNAGRQIAG